VKTVRRVLARWSTDQFQALLLVIGVESIVTAAMAGFSWRLRRVASTDLLLHTNSSVSLAVPRERSHANVFRELG